MVKNGFNNALHIVLYSTLIFLLTEVDTLWASPVEISGKDLPAMNIDLDHCKDHTFAHQLFFTPTLLASAACEEKKCGEVPCDPSLTEYKLVKDGSGIHFKKILCFPHLEHKADSLDHSDEWEKKLHVQDEKVKDAYDLQRQFENTSDYLAPFLVRGVIDAFLNGSRGREALCNRELADADATYCERLRALIGKASLGSKIASGELIGRSRSNRNLSELANERLGHLRRTKGRLDELWMKQLEDARKNKARKAEEERLREQNRVEAKRVAELEAQAREKRLREGRQAAELEKKKALLKKKLDYFEKNDKMPREYKIKALGLEVDPKGWVFTTISFPLPNKTRHPVKFANQDAIMFLKHFACDPEVPTVSEKREACTNLTGAECVTLKFQLSGESVQINANGVEHAGIIDAFKNRHPSEIGDIFNCGSK